MYVYGTFLTAAGLLRPLNRIAFLACALNVGLNMLLIPKYGIKAAAGIAVFTQAMVAVAHYYLTHKKYKIPFPLLFMGKIALIALAQMLVPLLFQSTGSHITVKIGGQFVITIVMLILLKIIDIKNIKQIITRS